MAKTSGPSGWADTPELQAVRARMMEEATMLQQQVGYEFPLLSIHVMGKYLKEVISIARAEGKPKQSDFFA